MSLNSLPTPAIFAHRGASKYAPENTISAFKLAIHLKADGIELDTKLTADGVIVVIHDQTVDRTTSNSGKVRSFSLEEIRNMDAGSHFDIKFRGEKIPTLREVFQEVGGKTMINVELANYATPFDQLPQKTATLVKEFGLLQSILFSSFNPIALIRIRQFLPDARIGILALPGKAGVLARNSFLYRIFRATSLHPEYRDVNQQLIDRAHQYKKEIFAWTVNFRQEMERLFELGVDGIITDDPTLAEQVRLAKGFKPAKAKAG